MKILIVANYAKEFVNKFLKEDIRQFKENGWLVDVACRADAEIIGCDHIYDLKIERNPFTLRSLTAIRQLKKIVIEGGYDIVHCHTFTGKVVGILSAEALRSRSLKIIYTSHGFQYFKGAPLLNWFLLPFDKWITSYTDCLITINQEDYDNAKKYNFKPKYILKSYGSGINLDKFDKESNANENKLRAELGLSTEAKVLIYVAELTKNKNQIMLLKMMKELMNAIPDIHLLLVGPDHSKGSIQKSISKMALDRNVHCLGWRDDVPDLIRLSDVAVASSIREGLGINIVEYMYCGIPVVATDNRGHREIIENEVNGFLVPLNDYKTMAEKVLSLLKSAMLRKKIAESAQSDIVRFSDRVVSKKLIDIYKRISQ